jgi:flagellar secretion chaperone FliS
MDARLSYREAAVRGASPVRLIVLLYEQILIDLRQALAALEKGDVETRTRAINHAILVIGQLQGSLDMQQGGEVARNLERFYNVIRNGLVHAHCRQSEQALQQQISFLMLVREAWLEVEHSSAENAAEPLSAPSHKPGTRPSTQWNA